MKKSKTTYALLLLTTLWFGGLVAQDKTPPKIYTPKQLEMIESQRELVKQNREAFRNSLSEEQKGLLKDNSLSMKERQQALMKTLTANQKEALKGNRESLKKLKDAFSKSLTEKQKTALKLRKKNIKERMEKLKDYKSGFDGR
ncbi:MAG: hypothetical protein ACPH28_01835, partial [Flavobacteriaceae bacterium]